MITKETWDSVDTIIREQINDSSHDDGDGYTLVGAELIGDDMKVMCVPCGEEIEDMDFIPGNIRANFGIVRTLDTVVIMFIHSQKPNCVKSFNDLMEKLKGTDANSRE